MNGTKNDTTTERNANVAPSHRPTYAIAWLAALLAVTLAVRTLDSTPWLGSDDASYVAAAEHVLSGTTITRVHHHYARLSVILPVAASIAVFGANVVAVELPSIILSIVCVLLVVAIGRTIWGWWVGLCAGSIVAVMPYFRMLSTTAYPDVHACFWATCAAFLILCAIRSKNRNAALRLGVSAGFALGLAASAKIFAGWTIIGLVAMVLSEPACTRRQRRNVLLAMFGGGILFAIVHGTIYYAIADDFWFKWHALTTAQGQSGLFPASGDPFAVGPLRFLWQRLTFLLHPVTSGWGWLALAFWPAALYVLFADKRGRPIAIWAIAAYLLVAFFPVSFSNGPRPYPSFVGRNILYVCVPFALCLAAAGHRLILSRLTAKTTQRTWPVLLAAIVAIAYANRHELQSFEDRHTSRIGGAITKLINDGAFDGDAEIHMTASMFWRFGVLFPTEMRSRLRVSADDAAPPWWRETTINIVSRRVAAAPINGALALATPVQFQGQAERWDYGVGIARSAIPAWQSATLVAAIDISGTIASSATAPNAPTEPVILLKRIHTAITNRKREKNHGNHTG